MDAANNQTGPAIPGSAGSITRTTTRTRGTDARWVAGLASARHDGHAPGSLAGFDQGNLLFGGEINHGHIV